MKTLRRLFTGMMTVLLAMSLYACQTDEEIGFDISGLFGKLWEANLGENVVDRHGNEWPIYSEFEFISGNNPSYGVGREYQRYMDNDELYQVMNFNWEVEYGDLVLDYGYGDIFWMHNLVTYSDYFSARVDNDSYRTEFYLVGTRATNGNDSIKVPTQRRIKGPIQFKAKPIE